MKEKKEGSSSKKKCSSCKKTATKPSVKTTTITAHYDCGPENRLFVRGEGISTLNWESGQPMKNLSPSTWIWKSTRPFSSLECKVLLNDAQFELGENHTAKHGDQIDITPRF